MKLLDADGKPVTLDTLCRKEPAWAANRIRKLREERGERMLENHKSLGILWDMTLTARRRKEAEIREAFDLHRKVLDTIRQGLAQHGAPRAVELSEDLYRSTEALQEALGLA